MGTGGWAGFRGRLVNNPGGVKGLVSGVGIQIRIPLKDYQTTCNRGEVRYMSVLKQH